ncbi:MAG: hypothetical protein WBA54_03830 [Acidaminobacteraceae bacterium]
MQTKYYHSTKKSVYMGVLQAAIISFVLLFLIVGFIVGSFSYNILFYVALFAGIFLITAFTLSPISGYYTKIDDKALVISSFKRVSKKTFEWDKVNAISIGRVYNKHSRYNTSYYGVEILVGSEFKNLTSTYKLIHLENHEQLMDEIIEMCKLKGIEYMDHRAEQL